MLTAIQPVGQNDSDRSPIDRLPTGSTLGDIHTAQIKETLSSLHDYKEGDLLKSLLPEGAKVRSTGETSKNHAAYMSGFIALIEALTGNTADFMKINGALQNNASQSVTLLQESNAKIAKQTTDSLAEFAAQKEEQAKDQDAMKIFGWVMCGLMAIVSFGTMSVAAAAVATVISVGAQVVNQVQMPDGKTLMQKLATALGGGDDGNTKATLLMDAIVLIATVGAGIGQAMAENTAEEAASESVSNASQDEQASVAPEPVNPQVNSVVQNVGEDAGEDAAEGSFKKLVDKMNAAIAELKEKAMELFGKSGAQDINSEAANREVLQSLREKMRSALGALEKLSGEVVIKGVGNGLKLGVQEIMTYFNPIGPIVSDAYYHANVRDNMSDQEKAALRSRGDLIGECVGAATSLAYSVAAWAKPNINGMNAFARSGTSATQLLLQKVATGLIALGSVGQVVIGGLLCDILRKAADTQEHVAGLKAESTKMQYAIDTMADTRRKISDESAQNAADLFAMLNILLESSKKSFAIR